jgi:zinc transporter ZupT
MINRLRTSGFNRNDAILAAILIAFTSAGIAAVVILAVPVNREVIAYLLLSGTAGMVALAAIIALERRQGAVSRTERRGQDTAAVITLVGIVVVAGLTQFVQGFGRLAQLSVVTIIRRSVSGCS